MRSEARQAIEEHFDCTITKASTVTGGDINESFEVTLSTGQAIFVKCNARAPATMFPAEAQGLTWLDKAGALRIPKVLGCSKPTCSPTSAFLALELLRPAPRCPNFAEKLGRGLAQLHQSHPPHFGLDHSNFIGSLSQSNQPASSWVEFYARERIEVQVRLGRNNGHFSSQDAQKFDTLCKRLENLVGPEESPARLHGDLWGGNLFVDDQGEPALIDPAVYGGHREMDLAMMRLFGGFPARAFDAYEEVYPLAPGCSERVPLYQLYPVLVHVNLFGGSYVSSAKAILARYL